MEKLLNKQVVGQIREAFDQIDQPVQMLFFGTREHCEYCKEAQQLLSELAEINERVHLSIHDIHDDAEFAAQYKVDKAPAIVIAGRDGDKVIPLGIQFSGVPSGYEFSTLINDILFASRRDSGLGAATREFLKSLTQPLLLQVFVTPT